MKLRGGAIVGVPDIETGDGVVDGVLDSDGDRDGVIDELAPKENVDVGDGGMQLVTVILPSAPFAPATTDVAENVVAL